MNIYLIFLIKLILKIKTLYISASYFNSLITKAKASGFTPFSHKLTSIDKVFLSIPQFKI